MISLSELNSCKLLAELMVDLIPGGIMFVVIETDTVVWKRASASFDIDILQVGSKLDGASTTMQAIRDKRVMNQKVPASRYGKRLEIVSIPITDEAGEAYGAFSIAIPKVHPVAASFGSFAPVLAEMFHDGAFLYLTDKNRITHRQPSGKFDMPSLQVGYELQERDLAAKTLQSGKANFEELEESRFGVPVFVANYPLFDEDDGGEVVDTLGAVTPRRTAATLREMSVSMENGLTGIAAAIEELAASATNIHTNEQALNEEILEVIQISDEINEISAFIKEIADETKMLGLNAAIEAARAGETGRGFGVVAEEIRKLSDQSKSTVPKIKKLTEGIIQKVNRVSEKSKSSLYSSQEQASATEEITAGVEEITAMSEELAKLSKTL